MPRLSVELPDGRTFDFELKPGVLRVGRSPQNELALQSLSLSRQHARFANEGKEWRVEDAGSRNGTFVNGSTVPADGRGVALQEGDEVRLGDVRMVFHRDRAPSVVLTPAPIPRDDQTFFLDREALDVRRYAAEERTRRESSGEMPNVWMLLGEAAAALIADYPLEQLFDITLDLVFKAVPAQRAAILLSGSDGKLETRASRNLASDQGIAISQTIVQSVFEEKRAVLTVDAQADQRFEAAMSVRIQGIRSVLCVPLLSGDEVFGMVYADSLIGRRAFHESDLRLLGLIANMAAVKIENLELYAQQLDKERMAEQIAVAQRIQRRLYPQENPAVAGYDLCGVSQPCFEIGGDYYDFLWRDPPGDLREGLSATESPRAVRRHPKGRLGLVVADVSGKGVGAALLMSAFQASLRTLVKGPSSPAELMHRVNEVLCENSMPGKFVTVFYGELDLETHVLEYVNAGHNPPILTGPSGVTLLDSTGPVTGLLKQATFASARVAIEPNSLLAIYSDGFTEAENAEDHEFGIERMRGLVERLREAAARDASQEMLQELVAFEGTAERKDDCTLLLVRRLPE